MKSFANKLNQVSKSKGDTGEPVSTTVAPSKGLSNDLAYLLEERIEKLETEMNKVKENKVDTERYDMELFDTNTRLDKLEQTRGREPSSPSKLEKQAASFNPDEMN
jgi:hypothetical protein